MKLYRETFRRLTRLGLVLLAVTVTVCSVVAYQDCMRDVASNAMLSAPETFSMPLMVFVYVGSLTLAFAGFSFLNRRADSDFYHSLPISRINLYASVSGAALTWIGMTVLGAILSVTCVHLITGRSFVPLYPLMNLLFYGSAALLIFAAAAIGMSLTGTWFSALIVTGLVLALPRFLLFIMARTASVKCEGLINWEDFGILLNPVYNTATSILVQYLRPAIRYNMMSFGAGLYSLTLGILELAVGALLFRGRRSELAESGARNWAIQTVFACLGASPLILVAFSGWFFGIASLGKGLSSGVVVLLFLSLAFFVVFQALVFKNWKMMAKTLPCYVLTLLLSLGITLGGSLYGEQVRSFVPETSQVAGVRFLPTNRGMELDTYRSMVVEDILFTDPGLIEEAASAYRNTQARQSREDYYVHQYLELGADAVRLPVEFTMKNGKTLVRNVEFPSGMALENRMRKNEAYRTAMASFAPADSICCWTEYRGAGLYQEDIEAIRQCYESEFPAESLRKDIGAYPLMVYPYAEGRRNDHGILFGDVQVGGYIGTRRYVETYCILPEMEKTASLWMEKCNLRSTDLDYANLMEHITLSLADQVGEWTSFYLGLEGYNLDLEGTDYRTGSMYLSAYGGQCDLSPEAQAVVVGAAKLLEKGQPSTDPNAILIRARYYLDMEGEQTSLDAPCYLTFDGETAEQLLELFDTWQRLEKENRLMREY